MMVDYRFEWSFDQTREENYRRWRQLNNAERDAYNIAQELEAGAREIFNKMEGSSLLHQRRQAQCCGVSQRQRSRAGLTTPL